MLRLILGGAGTGKSYRVSEMIKKDIEEGRRVYLLVPEQETVARERDMLFALPPSAQLSFEVLNFSRLANSVFRKHGGLTYNYVSKAVKHLVIWNTMRSLSPLLLEYKGGGEDTDLASLMLSQIEELKAYSISPSALERAAEKAQVGSRLRGKLMDISLIYAAYSEALSNFGASDASDDIGKLADKLEKHCFFEGTSVYIDSFTSFTSSEYRVISQILMQADSLTAALCIPYEGVNAGIQFESIADTLKKLETIAEKMGVESERTYLSENLRSGAEALSYLSNNIWRFSGVRSQFESEKDHVKLIKCTNIYEETDALCTEIAKLVRSGMRYRDIAVIARDISRYDGIIDNAFSRADIPYFMSKKEDVTAMPLAKLLLSALRIKNRGWSTEDVITYLKTGLTGISGHGADLFEQYIWKWSISGNAFIGDDWNMNPDSYSADVTDRGRAVLTEVNEVRRALTAPLLDLFEKLDSAESARDMSFAVYSYLEGLTVRESMKEFATLCVSRGEKADASRAMRLYNTVLDILGILSEFDFGDEGLDSESLERALRILLSETDLGVIPTSCDEVNIGSASLFRADKPKCVIMIGVNDGVFPADASDRGMLTDDDKQFLLENGIELAAGSEMISSEELFYVYRAVSAPSEKLIMTYASSELQGGKELRPSLAFERTAKLLSLLIEDYGATPISERLYSATTAFEYAAVVEGETGEALKRYFSRREDYKDRLNSLYIPLFRRDCSVSEGLAKEIFGKNRSFSPTALEKFVGCHFAYWCKYVLFLRPEEKNEFDFSDSGTLVHSLLENFVRSVTDENGFNADLAEEKLEELLDELMRAYVESKFPKRDAGRERVAHILSKLKQLSRLVAKNMTEELKNSSFVPSFFELKIGEKGEGSVTPLSVELSDGASASLRGTVDRVDLLREGDDVYVKVVDYKTGSKTFSIEDIKEGINLQMLLYLFSICGNDKNKKMMGCPPEGELKSAGVIYLSSKIDKIAARASENRDIIIEKAAEKIVRSGILLSDDKIIDALNRDRDFRYIITESKKNEGKSFKTEAEFAAIKDMIEDTLRTLFEEVRSGDASVMPKEKDGRLPCEYCEMKAVCRMGHIKKIEDNEEGDEN